MGRGEPTAQSSYIQNPPSKNNCDMDLNNFNIYRWRLWGIAALSAAAFVPADIMAQARGVGDDLDPLAAGSLFRASRMLTTGNALGALDQTKISEDDFQFLTPEQKAEWLATEGAALFEREDPRCLEVLELLASEYPASRQGVGAVLTAGDWYWLHKDWQKAVEKYSLADIKSLPDEERNLYSYRKALAYLKCGVPEKAVTLLRSLEGAKDYDLAARYYLAYTKYLAGEYDEAYSEMSRVAEDISGTSGETGAHTQNSSGRKSRRGQNLTPASRHYVSDGIEPLYYMAQIEYLRGEYPEVIDHAKTIMAKRPVEELLPELHRITGLSYFKTGDFGQARGHLEEYFRTAETPNDDAVYALGAIQYADNDLKEAEKKMQTLTDRNNALAQGAYLYLGQIAEREGDMNAAAMAFSKAAGMAFDTKVTETALYNHIVAISKGGNTPFASSITMLEDFLAKYPGSPYVSDVEESLATAYFHERDYRRALAAINRIKNPGAATLATKQKILYQYGMSEISAGQPKSAAEHLREAADMRTSDHGLASESRLWLGEALYRAGDYKDAAAAYETALKENLTADNKRMARYGLAYCDFQREMWRSAAQNFSRIADDSAAPESLRGDALVREADCLHYLGDHRSAADKYLKAVRAGGNAADYAAFRHAVVIGLTQGTDAKMRELDAFLSDRKGSAWTPQALLEAGKTMSALDRPDKAAPYLERLRTEYPQDSKSRGGALTLALTYMKQGKTAEARRTYMDIIRTWPTSEEASLANDDMRRIAAADGTLQEYADFLASVKGAPQINPDEMDSYTFDAAETAYAENPANTSLLEKYIERYPDGRYLANALMDLAEAADQTGHPLQALAYLERLIQSRGDAPQVAAALFLQGELLEDAGNREKALESFKALEIKGGTEFAPEATSGIMRCTSDAKERTEYARRLLAMGGVSDADAEEARYYEASGLLRSDNAEEGEKLLKELAKKPDTLSGAKAAVELGEWQLAQGRSKDALKTLEQFTDAGSVHAYWLARGFIALAAAYHAEGNDYLAAEYLKSLRDNYPGDEEDIRKAIESGISEYSKQ